MTERERERPVATESTGGPTGAGEGDGGDATRTRAERLLRAADDAIARALSEDSERFLLATRQSGGQ